MFLVNISTPSSKTVFKENDSVTITCSVNRQFSGNVTWLLTHLYNGTQREIKTTGISESSTSSNLTIHRVKCGDMGTYSCLFSSNATNDLIKSLNISVKCKPIIQMKNSQQNRTMAKVGETLVLSVFVFAFPKPQIKWYFCERTSRSRLMMADTDTKDYLNGHVSSVTLDRLQDKDFGTYFVNATNTVGSTVLTIMVEKVKVMGQKDENVTKSKKWLYILIPAASVVCLLFSLICAIRFWKKRQVENSGVSPDVLQNNGNDDEDETIENELYVSCDILEMEIDDNESDNADGLYVNNVSLDESNRDVVDSDLSDDHIDIVDFTGSSVKKKCHYKKRSNKEQPIETERKPLPFPRQTRKF